MYKAAKNIEDVKEGLQQIALQHKSVFTDGWGFKNTQKYLDLLGRPQDKHKAIHVAGTSGKGSTVYYISAMLIAAGYDVGTIVSPHVSDVRERAMINLKFTRDEEYINSFNKITSMLNDGSIVNLSNYEALILLAFDMFTQRNLDYVVVETGLGGLFDTTNTIQREDKVSVITKLGMDHVEILGPTLEDIARQKAGIMKHGKISIAIKPSNPDVQKVLRDEAKKYDNNLEFIEFTDNDRIVGVPDFQAENMFVARKVVERVANRDRFTLPPGSLDKVNIPGRFDVRKIKGKTVIFDGAHNAQKIQALASALKDLGYSNPTWVFGVKDSKDIVQMLRPITANFSNIIFTSFFQKESNERLKQMPVKTVKLQKIWATLKQENSQIVEDPVRAVKTALASQDIDPIVVTGSMYMVGEVLSSGQFIEQK